MPGSFYYLFYKICCGEKTGNNISENLRQLKFPDREVPFQGLRLNLMLKLLVVVSLKTMSGYAPVLLS